MAAKLRFAEGYKKDAHRQNAVLPQESFRPPFSKGGQGRGGGTPAGVQGQSPCGEETAVRKLLLCALMMTLLAGCGKAAVSEAEELALTIRGEYLAMDSCAVRASVTADYGQRVYRYELTAAVNGEETILTLSAPETVAGLTAHVTGKDSRLEFDGVCVETGPMDDSGLTPVSALPALLETARSGYIVTCALEEDGTLLRVDCGDPTASPGSGTETVLWFDTATHTLARGEVSVDGFRVVLCEFLEFTR